MLNLMAELYRHLCVYWLFIDFGLNVWKAIENCGGYCSAVTERNEYLLKRL